MTVILLPGAEEDLDEAFRYYESRQHGLGDELLDEFRHAVDRVIQFPHGWHPMDQTYRRCQLHRFPYGIIYRIDETNHQIVVSAQPSPGYLAALILHNTFADRPYRVL